MAKQTNEERMEKMNDPAVLKAATEAMADATTKQEVQEVWFQFYGRIGHKRLARILLGRNPVDGSKVPL